MKDFDFHAVQNDIKKLKIIAKGQESRIKSVEERYSGGSPLSDASLDERLKTAFSEQEQKMNERYGKIIAEQERRIKMLEDRLQSLTSSSNFMPQQPIQDNINDEDVHV